MRSDVVVLIAQAERKGAAFPVREGQVEVRGLERVPDELAEELHVRKGDVLKHLSGQEKQITSEETSHLLAWATELTEQGLELAAPVQYVDAPLRKVTTMRVSWYAAHYLKTIASAYFYQQYPESAWGLWTPAWWRECEEERPWARWRHCGRP